ncbi:MAG: hypothetical protein HYU67_04935 [Flavobacteriia bacterium]|nr:hypothetical protein [Flavobacteriia bacterium]
MKIAQLLFFIILFSPLIYSQNQEIKSPNIQDSTLFPVREEKVNTNKKNKTKGATKNSDLNSIYRNTQYQNNQKNLSPAQKSEIEPLIEDLKDNQTYEYSFYSYVFSDFSKDYFSHLINAKKLNPKVKELDYYFVYHYVIYPNKEKKIEHLQLLYNNQLIDDELIKYAKHLLYSVEQSAYLLIHGKDDFLPLLYVQDVLQLRKDVKLISLDLLRNEDYKQKWRGEGLNIPNQKVVDTQFFKEMMQNNSNKSIQISLTVPTNYIEKLNSNWYFKGLSIATQNSSFSNKNIYDILIKDKDFYYFNKTKTKKISSNYLPFLILLSEEYSNQNQNEKVQKINEIIEKIKIQCD